MMITRVLMFFQRHTVCNMSKYICKPHGFYVGFRAEIHEFYQGTLVVKFCVLLTVHLDIIV